MSIVQTIRSWVRCRVPAAFRRALSQRVFMCDGIWTVNRLTEMQSVPSNNVVRWATPDDLPRLLRFCKAEQTHMIHSDRLIAGSELTAVTLRNGEIIGFEVYTRHQSYIDEVPWLQCTLRANEALAIRVYVARAFRGQRIAHELIAFATRDFRRRGIETVYGVTHRYNNVAHRAHDRRGFKRWGRFWVQSVFGFKLVSVAGHLEFGLWSAARPFQLVPRLYLDSAIGRADGRRASRAVPTHRVPISAITGAET